MALPKFEQGTATERYVYPRPVTDLLAARAAILEEFERNEPQPTPWQDLNGFEPAAAINEQLGYARYIEEADATRPEIRRLFINFNLPMLNFYTVQSMTKADRQKLTTCLMNEIEGNDRPSVLMTPGCDYARFGFETEKEAREFGKRLRDLRQAIVDSDFYQYLVSESQKPGSVPGSKSDSGEFIVVWDAEAEKLRVQRNASPIVPA